MLATVLFVNKFREMARIFRTDIYDYQTLPTFDDYVIGTDPDDSNRTRNYRIADIIGLANGTATRFTTLFDTPTDYTGQAGKSVVVNDDENGLEFAIVEAGGADDTAYGGSWNSNLDAATKNALYDKIQTLVTTNSPQTISGEKTFVADINANAFIYSDRAIIADWFLGIQEFSQPTTTAFGSACMFLSGGLPTFLKANVSNSISRMSFDWDNTEPQTYTYQNKTGTIAHLDDIPTEVYGTFTPTVELTIGSNPYTQASATGEYLKIGRQVWINIEISGISGSAGPTDVLSVDIPTTMTSVTGVPESTSILTALISGCSEELYSVVAKVTDGSRNIVFERIFAPDNPVLLTVSDADFTSGSIKITGTFLVES